MSFQQVVSTIGTIDQANIKLTFPEISGIAVLTINILTLSVLELMEKLSGVAPKFAAKALSILGTKAK